MSETAVNGVEPIIFLDDVPHLYRPGDNSPFGYTFAQLGHLYLKSRHIVKF